MLTMQLVPIARVECHPLNHGCGSCCFQCSRSSILRRSQLSQFGVLRLERFCNSRQQYAHMLNGLNVDLLLI